MTREITKLVFKDGKCTKVIFGYVLEDGYDFVKIKSTRGATFTINKNTIVFTKTAGDNEY